MSNDKFRTERQHGLTREEWLSIYNDAQWADAVVAAVAQIAANEHAEAHVRSGALDVWGMLCTLKLVPDRLPTGEPIPQVIRDVQLSCVRGRKGPLDEAARKAAEEQLDGVKWLVGTVTHFFSKEELDARLQAAGNGHLIPAGPGAN